MGEIGVWVGFGGMMMGKPSTEAIKMGFCAGIEVW